MNGVTTAIVAFLFLALAIPSLIKNRTYYYASLVAILGVIFLDAAAHVIHTDAFIAFAYCIDGILQIAAILMLVASTDGLTMGELKGELGNMYEVVRRGDTEKEVVIPLPESMKQKAEAAARNNPATRRREQDDEPQVYKIGDSANLPPQSPQTPVERGPIPLD